MAFRDQTTTLRLRIMVAIRIQEPLSETATDFLRHCYRFTNEEWPHVPRRDLPDQGFEQAFRSSCVTGLTGWEVSQEREFRLGQELSTASGVLHEIDVVARHPDASAAAELKNRQGTPTKNDVVVFFAKLLDYLAANPHLLLKDVCPVFMSTVAFDINGLTACLGLGIHPVCPGLRPVPVLVDNAMRLDYELRQGLTVSAEISARFADYCSGLNNICSNLADTWIASRLGYRSENTVVLRATSAPRPAIEQAFRQLNTECEWLLSSVRKAMQ